MLCREREACLDLDLTLSGGKFEGSNLISESDTRRTDAQALCAVIASLSVSQSTSREMSALLSVDRETIDRKRHFTGNHSGLCVRDLPRSSFGCGGWDWL